MQFDTKSIALVKNSSITLAVGFGLAASYWRSLPLLAFGLLTIAFVPLSVWALNFVPFYIWLLLLRLLQPTSPEPPIHALLAPDGRWPNTLSATQMATVQHSVSHS